MKVFALKAFAISFVLLPQYLYGAPANRELFPTYLRKFSGRILTIPNMERFGTGATVRVSIQPSPSIPLTPEILPFVFEPAVNEDQALELAQILLWGTMIESRASFERILEVYEKLGFPNNMPSQSKQLADLEFETKVDNDSGFHVKFTAFVQGTGMGAKASIDRFYYFVGKDGIIQLRKRATYLDGPLLNWQITELLGEAPSRENEKRYENLHKLIKEIYNICPKLIPLGRSAGQ